MRVILLTQMKKVKIDDEDYERITQCKWNVSNNKGYLYARRLDGKIPVYMHRFIMNAKSGDEIDHINKDTLDNRKDNLRKVSKTLQRANSKKRIDSKNNYKGIHIIKNKYITARIRYNTKSIHLGSFKTEKEAAMAYNNAARKYYGQYAYLNEIY